MMDNNQGAKTAIESADRVTISKKENKMVTSSFAERATPIAGTTNLVRVNSSALQRS